MKYHTNYNILEISSNRAICHIDHDVLLQNGLDYDFIECEDIKKRNELINFINTVVVDVNDKYLRSESIVICSSFDTAGNVIVQISSIENSQKDNPKLIRDQCDYFEKYIQENLDVPISDLQLAGANDDDDYEDEEDDVNDENINSDSAHDQIPCSFYMTKNFDNLIKFAKIVNISYSGSSTLFRDQNGEFHICMRNVDSSQLSYIRGIALEYNLLPMNKDVSELRYSFANEHDEVIIGNNAIQTMATF